MLFVGDCWGANPVNTPWTEAFGSELKADYVQMGHHGNNSLPIDFYKNTGAGFAFFDAPEWLVTGETYDTQENIDALTELGITCVDYRTAPNQVKLYEE